MGIIRAKELKSIGGQALIEFAIVLPFMCILVLGIIDFGIVFYNKAIVTNASREGARVGIVYQGDTDGNYVPVSDTAIRTAVDNYLSARLITFSGTPTWNTYIDPKEPISPGGKVGVEVKYTHGFLAIPKFLGLGNTVTMGAKTVMRVE